jgi:hypothetical protein
MLNNSNLCQDTPALRTKLSNLHPNRHNKPSIPPAPHRPHIIVDPKELRKIFKRTCNGSAPSISGWTADLLIPVMLDEECFASVLAFVEAAANNLLPEPVRQLILQKTLIAPAKPNKLDTQPDKEENPRPITILEPLYQLTALYCLTLDNSALCEILQPEGQFGIGTRGGAELSLHLTQAALEDGGPNCAVLLDDKINCFNSIDRRDILTNLYTRPTLQNLFGISELAYGRPTLVVYTGDRSQPPLSIWCEEGSQQGCNLGTALCCMGLIPVNASIKKDLDCEIFSICDDSAVICPSWEDTLTALDRSLNSPTVTLSRPKTRILWPHLTPPPQGLVDGCASRGIRLVLQSTKHLGGIIGCNPHHITQHALDTVQSQKPFFDAISHPSMHKQIGNGLLRMSGSNRLNYLSRVQPPRLLATAAHQFDIAKLQAFRTINQLPDTHPNNFTEKTIIFDILGIQQTTKTITQAYYAASINALQIRPTPHPDTTPPPRMQHLQDCWERLSSDLPTADALPCTENGTLNLDSFSTLPTSLQSLPAFYKPAYHYPDDRPKIQRGISKQLRHNRIAHIKTPSNNSNTTIARINSITAKHALAWYHVTPDSARTTINNHEWSQAIHYITNAPLDPKLQRCLCGYDFSQPSASKTHCFSCAKFRKTLVNTRHNRISHCNTNQCNSLGITTISEFNTSDDASRKRPDQMSYFDSGQHLADTTVSEPTAPSNLQYAHRPGHLLYTMERAKKAKYKTLACFEGASFSTSAMEGMGAFGPEFLTHIDHIIKQATDNNSFKALASTPTALKTRLIAELSCTLMKGNAHIRSKSTQLSIAAHARTHSSFNLNYNQLFPAPQPLPASAPPPLSSAPLPVLNAICDDNDNDNDNDNINDIDEDQDNDKDNDDDSVHKDHDHDSSSNYANDNDSDSLSLHLSLSPILAPLPSLSPSSLS